ncbi:hypothetical protein [Carboxylicivirga taeanensis]|uniref:hypothetical protein n=1 Tax=Carboxylicivirga taeanensis TaxID=1416875 RepID=UPI003F6DF9C3
MNIKKTYKKPELEVHLIDRMINLTGDSWAEPPIEPTGTLGQPQEGDPLLKSTPNYEGMPSQIDAFGSESPEY